MVVVLALAVAPAQAADATGVVTAGAAKVAIDVPAGTPLGGYGAWPRRLPFPDFLGRHAHAFWFRPHEGREGEIAARALVFGHGDRRLVWIAADLLAVDAELTAEVDDRVTRALGGAVTLLLSASHTHSGPGAYGTSEILGALVVDRPDGMVRDTIVRALVGAARTADLRRVPARVGAAAGTVPDVTRPRLRAPVDPGIVVLKVTDRDGRAIAVVWNFAIHPTMLGPRSRVLSPDVVGIASRALEGALEVPALFVNGAVGDVSPRQHGRVAAQEVGAILARTAQALAARADPKDMDRPAVATVRVTLGRPSLTLANCVRGWLPRAVGIPVGSVFPSETTLTAVAIGDTAVVTIPGELQASLGRRIKEATGSPRPLTIVAGLSNGYLGYFVDRESFRTPAYVTCAGLYGEDGGERLTAAATTELRGLGEAR
jgi:hypothetical protein